MGARGRQVFTGALLAVALLVFVFHGVDWSALGLALRNARPLALVGSIVAMLAAYAVRAWRWGDLLAPLGHVSYRNLFSSTMIGFAAGLVIPRSGEFLRPWLIARRNPIPFSAGFATIVIERLFDLITVLFLFALYLFVLPPPAKQIEGELMDALGVAGALAGLVALAVLVFLLALHSHADRIVGVIERLLARAPDWFAEPAVRLLRTFSEGLAVLRAPFPHLAKIGLQSLLHWILVALSYQLNNMAFAIELPFHAMFLLNAFLVVGEAIPTPGLVGGFHAFYLLALNKIFGIDRTTAVAASIAAHALTNLPVLLIGLALLGRERLSFGRVSEAVREPVNRKRVQ
jgi:uncharacterized protein (TIRG00374 family)